MLGIWLRILRSDRVGATMGCRGQDRLLPSSVRCLMGIPRYVMLVTISDREVLNDRIRELQKLRLEGVAVETDGLSDGDWELLVDQVDDDNISRIRRVTGACSQFDDAKLTSIYSNPIQLFQLHDLLVPRR